MAGFASPHTAGVGRGGAGCGAGLEGMGMDSCHWGGSLGVLGVTGLS